MEADTRVRFAPSPTGPLHIGGVRTALYNYLFAKRNGGKFLLRIEDTDQKRFIPGAENHIVKSLDWCGITPDESCDNPGSVGPYRQSERKDIYLKYIQKLIELEKAYYAFDTPEELDYMRSKALESGMVSWQYNSLSREQMKNSLTLSKDEVKRHLQSGTPYTIRIKFPRNREIKFFDLIRGWVVTHTNHLDDKVLFKSDGLPTYHFANVVDDHLMKISHVIRGEEWLPSTPLHVYLYDCFGWILPKFAHLPLILKPEGNGKLSKRDGEKFGFPVYILDWKEQEKVLEGFEKLGFLPQGVNNFLALLGWNAGGDQEFYTMEELISLFSLDKVSKAGAKFDYHKAQWLNQKHLQKLSDQEISKILNESLAKEKITHRCSEKQLHHIARVIKDRCTLTKDIYPAAAYFFTPPKTFDTALLKKNWEEKSKKLLQGFYLALQQKSAETFDNETLRKVISAFLKDQQVQFGALGPVLRLALTNQRGGPPIPDIFEILGKEESLQRIKYALEFFQRYA